MQENLNKLNKILLSENVRENFYNQCSDYSFKSWLRDILPEIAACREQQQNNVWHIYNVLDHILISVEKMNKLTTKMPPKEALMLAYVMFLHDMGKPDCHVVKKGKDGKFKDSFPGHQYAGKSIASRVLKYFRFNEVDKNIIVKLVEDHDYFMFLGKENKTTPAKLKTAGKKKLKELSAFGNPFKINQMLVMVGLADNMAQNPELTKPAIDLIKTYSSVCSTLKGPKLSKGKKFSI